MLKSILRSDTEKFCSKEFDLLHPPSSPRLSARSAGPEDLGNIYDLIAKNVSFPVAPIDVMRFAMGVNRNNIIVFCRHGEVVGLYAMLMLTASGLEALLTDEFDGRDPKVAHLAPRLEKPAAIYQWLVVAPGLVAEGFTHISRFLRSPFYRSANLYMRAASVSGSRISASLGYRPVPGPTHGLQRYVRLINRADLARVSVIAETLPDAA
jgi:hypothetical protein